MDDNSHYFNLMKDEFSWACRRFVNAYCVPHVYMRPRIYLDGDQWCALYGRDLQEGVAAFGDTPADACRAFDLTWKELTPELKLRQYDERENNKPF